MIKVFKQIKAHIFLPLSRFVPSWIAFGARANGAQKNIVTGIELVLENYMKMLGPYKGIKSRIFGMLAK